MKIEPANLRRGRQFCQHGYTYHKGTDFASSSDEQEDLQHAKYTSGMAVVGENDAGPNDEEKAAIIWHASFSLKPGGQLLFSGIQHLHMNP